MIITTTPSVEGKSVTEHFGIVSTVALIMGSLMGNTREGFLTQTAAARKASVKGVKAKAEKLGADAVVGICIDYTYLAEPESVPPVLMVSVSGTAVKLSA